MRGGRGGRAVARRAALVGRPGAPSRPRARAASAPATCPLTLLRLLRELVDRLRSTEASQLPAVADAVQELLAARVQRDVRRRAGASPRVSTTCAETALSFSTRSSRGQLAGRRGGGARA